MRDAARQLQQDAVLQHPHTGHPRTVEEMTREADARDHRHQALRLAVKAAPTPPDIDQVDPVVPAVITSDEISRLTARIRELEVQHAAEIERRHRAEEALANTQFELIEARRRATENHSPVPAAGTPPHEPEIKSGSSDGPVGSATPVTDAPDGGSEMFSTLVSRLSQLREEIDRSVASSGTDPSDARSEGDGPRDEDARPAVDLPLRSRLSSAANARRRTAGSVEHRDAPRPAM